MRGWVKPKANCYSEALTDHHTFIIHKISTRSNSSVDVPACLASSSEVKQYMPDQTAAALTTDYWEDLC